MLLGGDEFRRTQLGNNNAYCQDNEISWYNWAYLGKHQEIHRFTQAMIAFRRAHPVLRKEAFYTDADIRWFNPAGQLPNWFDPEEKRLGCLIFGDQEGEPDLCLLFNASAEPVRFLLPQAPEGRRWHLSADTARPTPEDIFPSREGPRLPDQAQYRMEGRSSVLLEAL